MNPSPQASIFIIEDDPHFRETFVDVMSLRDVPVRGAGSGEEGLRALRDARPSVIILDVRLPDIHGFDVCRRIKGMEAFKDTPVVFVTAEAGGNDSREQAEGLSAGASLFLPKPIMMERLWAEIEPLFARS